MKRFDSKLFESLKNVGILGSRLIFNESVGSTMTVARESIFNIKPGTDTAATISVVPDAAMRREWHGAVFVADEQTSGQGRRGRSWTSRPGNLYFTLAWLHDPKTEQFKTALKLNFATPLAIVKELHSLGIESAKTKWPNDCWIGNRKVCGMLIDNSSGVSLVGVGLNLIDNFKDEDGLDSVATSIERALQQKTKQTNKNNNNTNDNNDDNNSREKLLVNILERIESMMSDLTMDEVLQEYSKVHMLQDAIVRVHHKTREEDDDRDYDALVDGLAPFGMLRVRALDQNGKPTKKEIQLSGEEVSLVKIK